MTPIGTELVVFTWNVWGRSDWPARLQAIRATLAAVDPDVIALQEVARGHGEGSQARHLAHSLNRFCVEAHPTASAEAKGRGLAVLSRWPITSSTVRRLTDRESDGGYWAVLRAEIQAPFGLLPVHSARLSWRPDQSWVRQAQVRELVAFVAEAGRHPYGFPPIVCGDFNATPDTDEIRMLVDTRVAPIIGSVFGDAWVLGGDGGGHTWSTRNPNAAEQRAADLRLDYILVRRDNARAGLAAVTEVVEGQRRDGQWPSDHFGVLARLSWR